MYATVDQLTGAAHRERAETLRHREQRPPGLRRQLPPRNRPLGKQAEQTARWREAMRDDTPREHTSTCAKCGWSMTGQSAVVVNEFKKHGCIEEPKPERVHEPKHGTLTEYRYWKCRCVECRAANADEGRRLRRLRHDAAAA